MSNACVIFCVLLVPTIIVIMIICFQSGNDVTPAPKPPINYCKEKDEPTHKEYLVENNLYKLRNDDNFTDIEVVSQNVIIHAHKIILAAHSKYFDSVIWLKNQSNPNDTSGKNYLDLSYMDQKSVSHVLNFIYTGSLPTELFDNENEYSNLLRTANEFQLNWLKCEISKRLSIRINIKNCPWLVVLAEETDSTFLMVLASRFLLEHFHEISVTAEWKELIKNHPNIMTIAIDFQGRLPANATCDIQCAPSNISTPSVYTKLRRFFLTQRHADAEVHVQNGKVYRVNRAILKAQSPLFRQQFDASPYSIEINNTSSDVAEEFLIYMYSSWPTQLKKLTEGLLYLSDRYQMEALKKACEDIIIDRLMIENAAKWIIVADTANSKRIGRAALDFILKHLNEVVTTKAWTELKEKHPELLANIFSDLP